jgi:membrane protein DedA with SNARE-associated domain
MFFDSLDDIILSYLRHDAFLYSILLLILDEAGLPIPVADLVTAYMGYQVSQGKISFLAAFAILMIADLIGATILYHLSEKFGEKLILKFGKYIHLDMDKLKMMEMKFKKHGVLFIVFGRHIPGMRVPITVFAGMSEITYGTFILSTFASLVWWIPLYLTLGQRLGRHTISLFHQHAGYSMIFLAFSVCVIVGFFWFLRKKK